MKYSNDRRRSQRVLALLLSALLLLSNFTGAVYANSAPTCGQDVHSHTEGCYTTASVLTCTEEDGETHTHGEGCYTQQTQLSCTLAEHSHSDACYPAPTEETGESKPTEQTQTTGETKVTEETRTQPVCTCGTETGEHTEGCALYVAPKCTCGTETGEHTEGCALYVAPKCTCGTETEEHTEGCALYVAPKCTCGTETEEHSEGCALYVAPKCTCGTETEEHSEDCPLYEAPQCTCGTETEEHSEDCPLYEAPQCTCGTETEEHSEDCPLYEAPQCTCGTETEEHSEDCPLYEAPQCTCGTETEEHSEDCPLYEAPECTCGTTTDEHSKDCPLYEPTYFEKLLAAKTLKEFHDLLMSDTEAAYLLTLEEITQLKAHVEALYTALETPTEDEEDYYTLITDTLTMLEQKLQPPVTLIDGMLGTTVYFDLALGNVSVTKDGYSGYVNVRSADGTLTPTEVKGEHSDSITYRIFQSNDAYPGYVTLGEGDAVASVQTPGYDRVSDWGSYITANQSVANVVSQWSQRANGRTATGNHIHFKGDGKYNVIIENIWSNYQAPGGNSRVTGGFGYVPTSETKGTMVLTLLGDNRLESLHTFGNASYDGAKGTGNKLTIRGQSSTDTLTVAGSTAGRNTYNSAIGGCDSGGDFHAQQETVRTLEFAGGIVFAGAHAGDYCTAIGGGGNGYADIIISGGTVTAVTASNGAAIGGGFGGTSPGGQGDVTIRGGTVYAYNLGSGTAIGGGSSNGNAGGGAKVTITGGTVLAQTAAAGAAIGGGNSRDTATAGSATVTITGGTVSATSAGTVTIGGGIAAGGGKGTTTVDIAPQATVTLDNSGAKKVEYRDTDDTLLYTFYRSGDETPEFQNPISDGKFFLYWQDAEGNEWTSELTGDIVYKPYWIDNPFTDAIYFDLALADVTITESTYSGMIYDQIRGRAVYVEGSHTNDKKYFVYQSTTENVASTGIYDGGVAIPAYDRIPGWAGTITNNSSVSSVISAWTQKAGARTTTPYHIHVTGSGSYDVTVQDIWSSYCEVNVGRTTGGVGFRPTGSGNLKLTWIGDNRLESIHYTGSASQALTLTGKSSGDTMTVAATKDGGNYWCSAIGGDDGVGTASGIRITGGTLFAGTRQQDNSTAIGGGGNAHGGVTITGGTVTAVVSSSGTAIGGGIGYHSAGGNADVTISGGSVYAYNHGILLRNTKTNVFYAVPSVAIGGGSSIEASGNDSTNVTISGGYVYAQSIHGAAIGGGGSSSAKGGNATINITGGTVRATSIAGSVSGIRDPLDGQDYTGKTMSVVAGVSIGGGTGHVSGGTATVNISGNAVIDTGSIGGGQATQEGAPLGYAQVTISGGTTQGQVIMQTTGSGTNCSFTMTGGKIDNTRHKAAAGQPFAYQGSTYTFLEENGGAVCMYDANGTTTITGGSIENAYGENGGAVYMTGGTFTLEGGTITGCSAQQDGGAVYLGGGSASVTGGSITGNTAGENGGGIAVNNGIIVMSGGNVDRNRATGGSGGGMYVASSGSDVAVKVYSGSVSSNTAAVSGGAVGVEGKDGVGKITVQIGVNEVHTFSGSQLNSFQHNEPEGTYLHQACPVVQNNTSGTSGGAFFITGGSETRLNMYCLEESGNTTTADKDINNKVLSDFLMVQGGKVIISSADTVNGVPVPDTAGHGNTLIHGTVHVISGTLDLYGTMDNPSFRDRITIDLTKEGDYYADHRTSDSFVKLSYHENFYHPDGTIDSTQTALDIPSQSQHTISSNLYVHSGYRIVGWNTDPKATSATQTGWYNAGAVYTFLNQADASLEDTTDGKNYYVGNELIIYAIWEANGYFVKFLPNVPENEKYTGAMDELQPFNYGETKALNANAFKRPGYVFDKWAYTTDSGTVAYLTDGQSVTNLTTVNGRTVELRAQWIPCDHHDATYSVEVVAEQEQILKKSCTCGYEATVTIKAEDTVYDGFEHKYLITWSDPDGFHIQPECTAVKIGSTEAVAQEDLFVAAGVYTVSVTAGGKTATVTYTIDKAPQDPPAQKPTYTEPAEGSDQLTIHPIPGRTEDQPGGQPEYFVRYYDEQGNQQTLGPYPHSETDISVTLPESLKNYTVSVRYAETDNFYPSDEVLADSTFFFHGKVKVVIKTTEGITYRLDGDDTGLNLYTELKEDYYLYTEDGKFLITRSDEDSPILTISPVATDDGSKGHFRITCPSNLTEETTVTLTLGKAKKLPTIRTAVEEKQIFGSVTGDSAVISRDSAFTVCFTLENFDTEDYLQPVLQFTPGFPQGTSIILLDKTDNTYWACTNASGATVALDRFIRMGTASTAYQAASGDRTLQFIVDFPDDALLPAGEGRVTLHLAKRQGVPKTVPDLTRAENGNIAFAPVTAQSTGFSLTREDSGGGLEATLHYSFSGGAAASRWDHRELALVLTPTTELPPDAILNAQVGNYRMDCRMNQQGKIIIPLDGLSGSVVLRLSSEMFPSQVQNYPMTAQLMAARSVAEDAPMNGDNVSTLTQNVVFTSTQRENAIRVTEANDKRLFVTGETIAVNVAYEIADGYRMKVLLEHKDYQSGTYVDTTYSYKKNGNVYSFALTDCAPGSYRVLVLVERSDGLAILEAPYYFIIH